MDSSESTVAFWCVNRSHRWLIHSSLPFSCLLVDANQRGLSGPVTDFHHSHTYSRDCSSSAKARRRGSHKSTPCGIGIQHSPNSPSWSSEDRRLSRCLPGSPWSALLYCAMSSKGISMMGWEEGGKVRNNQHRGLWWQISFNNGFEICSDSLKVPCISCHLKGWESEHHIISVALLLWFMPALLVFGSRLLINIWC